MQNIKPNRAQRRAAKSKRPANYRKNRHAKKNDGAVIVQVKPAAQIAAPSRATRFSGMT
jgi:hypothetical protein